MWVRREVRYRTRRLGGDVVGFSMLDSVGVRTDAKDEFVFRVGVVA